MGLLKLAAVALVGAERRTEMAARNIANAQTPGYRREVAFSEIAGEGLGVPEVATRSVRPAASGGLTETGAPLDLALQHDGFLLVRDGERFFLSRGGQFRRDAEGALADGGGRILQQAGGGDVILDADDPEILADGTILVASAPVGAIGLYAAPAGPAGTADAGLDAAAVTALAESDAPGLRQGMLERSNVVLSDEMIGLMRNQRLAEGGAQLVHAYDQLVGQAIATFGKRN